MKVFLSLLLVAVTCIVFAQTLQCYTCREPTAVDKCLTIHNCTQNETMCKTTLYSLEEVYTFEGVSTVTKMCSSACIPSDVDDIGTTRPVSCCYSELCNVDGAASLRISFVPVGILASSLCAAFWTRP
ncbi:glycosylphosphatidylinositol-anchored high density lipoprotein-binding protein 1 [Falco naumanni]|uniref:glycosylphosphatidylinositol-anchored high density lipoprotein-binding protein 1 n=1 Tax=Falco naumanni TaxID=148594 RepID=UPI001ADE217C|nr:glycosylphosphatidylinositol-anchored high density lipoprotein-binding protein 1 [Falco naumanni]